MENAPEYSDAKLLYGLQLDTRGLPAASEEEHGWGLERSPPFSRSSERPSGMR